MMAEDDYDNHWMTTVTTTILVMTMPDIIVAAPVVTRYAVYYNSHVIKMQYMLRYWSQ